MKLRKRSCAHLWRSVALPALGLALLATGGASRAPAAVPVLDTAGGNVIGELAFSLNASGTGERFFGFNAKQTLGMSLVLDATGDPVRLRIANATQRSDFHETDPPYVQIQSTTVTGSWSGPVAAFIVTDVAQGLDLLWIELLSGEGRRSRHGASGVRQTLAGPLDPSELNVLLVYFVNADGVATLGLEEGEVFALDGLMRFVDEDDPAATFGIGPNLPIVTDQFILPVGEPIPGGQGLRGRIDQVTGRLRY